METIILIKKRSTILLLSTSDIYLKVHASDHTDMHMSIVLLLQMMGGWDSWGVVVLY